MREEQSTDKWVQLSNAQRVNSAVSRGAVNDSQLDKEETETNKFLINLGKTVEIHRLLVPSL